MVDHIYSAGIITYIIDNDEILYLLLQHSTGHWDFPKGKIEPQETKQEAAIRELHEETGLVSHLDETFEETINYVFLDYNKKITQKTVYFFIGKATNSTVILSDEHIDYEWLPYKQGLKKLTYENARIVLKKANKHIITESKPL